MRRAAAIAGAALVTALRVVSAPPWPDDWDGVGFVESIRRFDLAQFTPHPPGYPVYVAMLRMAAIAAPSPIAAANAVAVASGVGATMLLAWAVARGSRAEGDTAMRSARERAAWCAALVTLAPLAWRSGTAIGSEAPALLFACAAALGATLVGRRAAGVVGASVGLGLGVRLSWAPAYLALLLLAPRGARRGAWALAALTSLAWAVPLAAVVGPSNLWNLARTHADGHFHTWGGTAITRPGLAERAADLGRDVFVDGLGVDRDLLGAGVAVAAVVVAALGLRAWRARGFPRAALAALLLPYLAWVALGQNLHDQPRHALPLVVVAAAALGLAATTSRAARVAGGALVALVAARTASDAYARRTVPPPGEQLVALASSLPSPAGVAVFGGPSARFFELHGAPPAATTVGSLGDVRLALGRFDALPARVLVTGEVDGLERTPYPLVRLATLCRPSRVDRRAPCLDVYDWRPPFLAR